MAKASASEISAVEEVILKDIIKRKSAYANDARILLIDAYQNESLEFEFEPINNYGNHEFSKFKVIIPNSSCLTVYPNPFTDYVMLNYSTNNAIDGAIKISDISGKVVLQIPVKYSAANIKIDVSSLVAGNYIVMLEGKDGIIEKSKLVIYK